MGAGRVRARRGNGSIRVRNGRLRAQVSLGADPSGRRIRRTCAGGSPAKHRRASPAVGRWLGPRWRR
jgi:hypothetical protein